MNCFKHADVPAVGLCKFCQKALCKECAHDLSYGLACREHIPQVTSINTAFEKEASLLARTLPPTADIFLVAAGAAMVVNGLITPTIPNTSHLITVIAAGVIALLIGALHFISQHLQKRKSNS